MAMWTTGLHLLGADIEGEDHSTKRLEYLRTMMLRNPEDVSNALVWRFASVSLIILARRDHQGTGSSFDSRR
jgi:hypothetical protein